MKAKNKVAEILNVTVEEVQKQTQVNDTKTAAYNAEVEAIYIGIPEEEKLKIFKDLENGLES